MIKESTNPEHDHLLHKKIACEYKLGIKIGFICRYIADISDIGWYRYDFAYRKLVVQKIEKMSEKLPNICEILSVQIMREWAGNSTKKSRFIVDIINLLAIF